MYVPASQLTQNTPGKNSTCTISHVLNEQGTGYEYLISIELKNESRLVKEHPKVSKSANFEGYWFKRKGMVRF